MQLTPAGTTQGERRISKAPPPASGSTYYHKQEDRAVPKKLFNRHRLVIAEYMRNGFNQRKAMRACGYSEETCNTGTNLVFGHPLVKAEIDRLMAILFEQEGVTEEWVIARLKKFADFDPVDVLDDDGKVIPISEMTHKQRAGIAELTVGHYFDSDGKEQDIKVTVKARDALGATDKLARILGMYNDTVGLRDENETIERILRARERAAMGPPKSMEDE